jgi:hypothetical protein
MAGMSKSAWCTGGPPLKCTLATPPRYAGTPSTNATFFCEALSGNCFLLRSGAAVNLGFYQAADLCAAYTGGNLAVYDRRGKQMLVGSVAACHATGSLACSS